MSTSRNSVAVYHALKRSIERQISISRFFSLFKCQDDSAVMLLWIDLMNLYLVCHIMFRVDR